MAPALPASPAAVAASPVARAYTIGGAVVFVVALGVGTWRFVALGTPPADGPLLSGVLVNTVLFGIFALHHSVLAREPVKAAMARLVSPSLERSTYVWVASVLFLVACLAWRPIAGVVYQIPPPWAWLIGALQLAGGLLTLDAARRIDVRVLAGLRPEPAQDGQLVARGTYRVVRHPIYLGWVLLVWATPDMTTGRLVFAIISTAYLVVAVPFEERSLRRRFGPSYDAYRRQVRWRIVPGLLLMAVVFYITGHGFGHAVRQIAIVNALAHRRPDVPLIVRSSVASWLFSRSVRASVRLEPGVVDTGAIQRGSLDVDIPATLAAAQAFYAGADAWIAQEAAFLAREGARLIVSDIPPLPIAAARRAGVPAIGISNFTWDWIYEDYEARRLAPGLVETLEAHYATADEGWRLPMHGGFASFGTLRDLPLVARVARQPRDVVRAALGLPPDQPLVLMSLGGYGAKGIDLHAAAASLRGIADVVATSFDSFTPGEGVHRVDEAAMYGQRIRYEDLVGAVDVVASKPGYGIISECAANGTALLYTDRGRFCEYEVLVRDMPRLLDTAFIDQGDLLAGRWREPVAGLLARPPRPAATAEGAATAADWLSDRLDLSDPVDGAR